MSALLKADLMHLIAEHRSIVLWGRVTKEEVGRQLRFLRGERKPYLVAVLESLTAPTEAERAKAKADAANLKEPIMGRRRPRPNGVAA